MRYPSDLEQAADEWNANCGPGALAAILDLSLAETKPLLRRFEHCGCMNITDVLNALTAAQRTFTSRLKARPAYGLIFIQWGGHSHKPARAQYRFTHWIAVDGESIFDVNLPELVTWNDWCATVPRLMQEEGHSDGTFFIRSAIAVHKT